MITIKIECIFVKKFEIDKLAKCMFDDKIKLEWDQKVEQSEFSPLFEESVNVGRLYTKNKKQLTLGVHGVIVDSRGARDNDEKMFITM